MPPEVRQAHKTSSITYFQKQEHEAILEEFTYMFVYLFPSIWQTPSQDRELKPKGGSFCIQSPLSDTLLKQDCHQSPLARARCFEWHRRLEKMLSFLMAHKGKQDPLLGADLQGDWFQHTVEVSLQVWMVLKPQCPVTSCFKPLLSHKAV